jgi:hypothetical protein
MRCRTTTSAGTLSTSDTTVHEKASNPRPLRNLQKTPRGEPPKFNEKTGVDCEGAPHLEMWDRDDPMSQKRDMRTQVKTWPPASVLPGSG